LKRIYSKEEIPTHTVVPDRWTAVIPVAGKGSRLGYDRPKVLYPVLGRPILHWLIQGLQPLVREFVWIVSPAGRQALRNELERHHSGARHSLATQESPRGMADAILCARAHVSTPHTIVIWGDQVTVSQDTVRMTQALHESRPNARLTLPTVLRRDPYIHLERDDTERIIRVHRARCDAMPFSPGENDCGLFAFRTRDLFDLLDKAAEEHRTKCPDEEFDLLPLFPDLDRDVGEVACWRLDDPDQTLGVNTLEDARRAEDTLCQKQPKP